MNTPVQNPVDQQERLAAAIGALIFFVPFLMDKITEFTVFYMRQGFIIFVLSLIVWVLAMIFPFLGVIIALVNIALAVSAIFLAFKAYQGEKFTLPVLYDWSVALIRMLGLEKAFSPKI